MVSLAVRSRRRRGLPFGRATDEARPTGSTRTHFWGPDADDKARITRLGRVQDVRDGLSEFPHVIVNQARLLDFLLEHMHNSPSRLGVDYGHETLEVKVPENPDERVTVRVKTAEGGRRVSVRSTWSAATARTAWCATPSAGCPEGHGEDKVWGVMDVLAVTDFPDIRFKCTIQSAEAGNILLIPREGGYMVRLYVDMGNIAPDAWLTREDVLAKAQAVLAPYTFEVKETAGFSVYRVGHRVTDKFDDVDDDQMGEPHTAGLHRR